ncbi:hypothetical protein B0A55_01155 [Friedmanniomyces simplex]|uniref:ESCRT-II complex subunit VPS25 n=1 Tax=Friedmanniomyces simplex TaxID=329884 RepID=A0A4U0Y0P5_9PEZI|nr:hypothetical protein B0A55_01155 [Friedmanniomyces simplex]
MATTSPEPSHSTLSTAQYTPSSSTAYTPSTPTTTTNTTTTTHSPNPKPPFPFPTYTTFPPFYTLQPNLTTRARQLDLWSSLITAYTTHHRLFRLSLSTPPADLFANPTIHRALKPADIRAVLDHMAKPENGGRVEWIPSTSASSSSHARGEQSSTCWVYWKTLAEWADTLYGWVDETGQKGVVLTVYELREGDGVRGKEWREMEEGMLRKVLGVLVKRGKAQVFGLEESAGVKFF